MCVPSHFIRRCEIGGDRYASVVVKPCMIARVRRQFSRHRRITRKTSRACLLPPFLVSLIRGSPIYGLPGAVSLGLPAVIKTTARSYPRGYCFPDMSDSCSNHRHQMHPDSDCNVWRCLWVNSTALLVLTVQTL